MTYISNIQFEPRWYQEEAVDKLFDYFATHDGKANPLIALPTGTGKSIVIAEFIKRVFWHYPQSRVMMSTHIKELIKQNYRKMLQAWPMAPVGIFSAGLRKSDRAQPIIFGGVRSMVGKNLGFFDLLVIDEAHLVNDDGSYMKLIIELLKINPKLKVIGLSATVYRLGLGLLTNGPIFTDVIYDLTNIEGFARLIADGFLCPLIPKRTKTEFDVSKVHISGGDYVQSEVEREVNKREITMAALNEFVYYGQERNSWLIFATGIDHANNICDALNDYFKIETVVVHSDRSETENDAAIDNWQKGRVRCAVNVNSLTTGIDHPALDYIGMMRPTISTGLWVQMLGRGTRPFPGKDNCLVMDFAGNTRRLGPINDPMIPKLKSKGEPGDAPVKVCEFCGTYNHARATLCIACGQVFMTDAKINKLADTAELLRSDLPVTEEFQVNHVVYSKHISKRTGNVSLKASYYCAPLRTFYEYISFEASGFRLKLARDWFRQRFGEPWENMTVDDALKVAATFRSPRSIRVWINKEMPEILGVAF